MLLDEFVHRRFGHVGLELYLPLLQPALQPVKASRIVLELAGHWPPAAQQGDVKFIFGNVDTENMLCWPLPAAGQPCERKLSRLRTSRAEDIVRPRAGLRRAGVDLTGELRAPGLFELHRSPCHS